MKLNIDGSCWGNPENCSGVGLIQDNKVHGTFSSCFGHGTNNEVELSALKEGVELCKSLGYSQIIIECDSLSVANWLLNGRCTIWYLWDFWEETLQALYGINYRVFWQDKGKRVSISITWVVLSYPIFWKASFSLIGWDFQILDWNEFLCCYVYLFS